MEVTKRKNRLTIGGKNGEVKIYDSNYIEKEIAVSLIKESYE